MDTSSSTDSQPSEFSDYNQRVVVAIMIGTASLVGIIGNSLVIGAVLLSKVLQTTTTAFIFSMSVAHLLCSLVLPWDVVVLLSTGDLPRGDREWICSVTTVTISITIGVGLYTLAAIGLNHMLLITRPTAKFFTPKKIAAAMVVTWLIPCLVVVVPPLIKVGQVGFNEKFHLCGSKFTPGCKTYNSIRVLGLYPIPLVCIIVCCVLIWSHLRRHAHVPATSSDIVGPTQMITKTMPFLLGATIIFMTPYALCRANRSFEPALAYASAILFSSCSINPIIYGIRHRDFKTVFGCILRRGWNDIPQPSALLQSMGGVKSQDKEEVGLHGD
ncbi:rhodopsin, GQ-coupled-like [Patiria miniata]|uniref:G-protein coupled receptors family 1 profile domain-containing protein n=1 Tax=Patiria miniata TaxID=46514 RepID=A0A914BHG1_PATMI|nr:rhodopsin, GQ-coupled-like [Patiria miniata]